MARTSDPELDDAVFRLVDLIGDHRHLPPDAARARLVEALRNMLGMYTVTGRLPDEIVCHPYDKVVSGLDRPPRFDAAGYAVREV